ncbi:hypothetical protein PINS_up005096 [Pythium insidiosum]|nr:hypothetical protein PINS_up005096 [Pythium insidiosum]
MSAADATRFAALTIEPQVLERIVALLPMDSASHAIGDATALLQTVARICCSLPKDYDYLVRHIGPQNRAFWRDMVLRCFDFTINHNVKFNVEDYNYVCGRYNDRDASEFQRAAVEQWLATHPDGDEPDMMLSDDLAYWAHLDVFFQPQQYGFLRKIQYGELGLDAWPDHEDPFTLFCDLAFIKDTLHVFKGVLETFSDGEQLLEPVFLSSYPKEVTRRDQAFLQHCGYAPHVWTARRKPISNTWEEFGPKQDDDDVDEDDRVFVDDGYPFPLHTYNDFQALVRRFMDDFRAVAVNPEECHGPTFHVGRMKRSGRWLGFVGQRDY